MELNAGQSRTVTVEVPRERLAHWDIGVHDYVVEPGVRLVSVGASSRDIRLTSSVDVTGDTVRRPLTLQSSIAEALANPVAAEGLQSILGAMFGAPADTGDNAGTDILSLIGSVPLGRLVDFSGGRLPRAALTELVGRANSG